MPKFHSGRKRLLSTVAKLAIHTPERIVGTDALNQAGLQIARYWLFRCLYGFLQIFVRRPLDSVVSDIGLAQLEKEGYLKIDHFLGNDDFFELLESYGQFENSSLARHAPEWQVPRMYQTTEMNWFASKSKVLSKYFGKDSPMQKVINYFTRIKANINPRAVFHLDIVDEERVGQRHSDFQDVLHYDVSYPTFKCILYLADCDETNGAFKFVPQSHRYSEVRQEIESSLCQNWMSNRASGKALTEIRPELIEKIGQPEISLNGRANTLVIFNAMGLHRRGNWAHPGSRRLLFVEYREMHSLLNLICAVPYMTPILKKTFAMTQQRS